MPIRKYDYRWVSNYDWKSKIMDVKYNTIAYKKLKYFSSIKPPLKSKEEKKFE